MSRTDMVGLDSWITGNYGEDQFDGTCDGSDCPAHMRDNHYNCPYDYNHYDCKAEEKAAAAEARWEMEMGR